jgi:hypothetical protein
MGGGGRMACCSAPPTSPTRGPPRGKASSARGGGGGGSSLAAALAARRKQQGLPPASPRRGVAADPATHSSLVVDSPPRRPYVNDPYQRRARTAQPAEDGTIQRVHLAEAEAMVAAVAAGPDGYGMFVSQPRQTRQGELAHWCQLYRDGTFRHGCTLGTTAHEQMGPLEADGSSRFVVGSTVAVEVSKNVRGVELALQTWQISEPALGRRPEGEQLDVMPADWVQGAALHASLRCSPDPAEPAALAIENWASAMGTSVPPPDRESEAGRTTGELVSWWNAAEFHSRMIWDPDRAPPDPPTQVQMPPAPIVPSPRGERAQFADEVAVIGGDSSSRSTSSRRRISGAAGFADTPGSDSRRAMWRQQKPLLEVLARLADSNAPEAERTAALRDLNELITLDPEAQQSFVARCTEDPALELAIRELLPTPASTADTDTAVLEPGSATEGARQTAQAHVDAAVPYGSDMVHEIPAAAYHGRRSFEEVDSHSGTGGADAAVAAARSAQFARLSDLM